MLSSRSVTMGLGQRQISNSNSSSRKRKSTQCHWCVHFISN